MKRLTTLVATLLASLLFTFGQPTDVTQRLESHIEFLTSSSLQGRKAGESGCRMAAEYISNEFDALGLKPFQRADFFHPFTTAFEDGVFRNVVGRIDGIQRDKYIVIGAHYDHLGTEEGEIYAGANDNASGTAALIELARLFSAMNYKPTHTLIFAAFDAEEIGLYGSRDLADRFHGEDVKVMINMDMVGLLEGKELTIEGVGTLDGSEELLSEVAAKMGIKIKAIKFEKSLFTATDTESFAEKNIPTLSLSTGKDSAYHSPQDVESRIDYQGLTSITHLLREVIVRIDQSEQVVASGKVARKHNSGTNNLLLGLAYSSGNNHHTYPGTALRGREAGAWNLGFSVLYTRKHLGFRTGIIYESRKALTPEDTANPFGPAKTIATGAVTMPMELVIKTKGNSCLYATVGGYYSHNLISRENKELCGLSYLGLSQSEIGWQWSLGVRLAGFFIEGNNRYSLTPTYTSGPTIYNRTSYCTLGIYF